MSSERIMEYMNEISTKTSSPCFVISPLINQHLSVLCFCPDGFSDDSPPLAFFSNILKLVERYKGINHLKFTDNGSFRNHDEWSNEQKGVPLAEIYINMLRYLCNFRRIDMLKSDGSQDFHIGDDDYL